MIDIKRVSHSFQSKSVLVIFIFRDPPQTSRTSKYFKAPGSKRYFGIVQNYRRYSRAPLQAHLGLMRNPGVSFRIFITRVIHHEDLIDSWDLTIVYLHYSPPSTPEKTWKDPVEIENTRLSCRVKTSHYFSLTFVSIVVSPKIRNIIFVSRCCVKVPLLFFDLRHLDG